MAHAPARLRARPQYSGEAQPLVYRGVVYVSTGANDVFAVSVESGEILWEYRANLDPANSAVCCGWTSRGVGLGDGKVFVGQLDGKLVALDQRSGKVVWSVQAERWQEGYTITSAPLYYDGLVITGFAGGERGIRGRVKAFSAKHGKLVWTFYTIPGPGEVGHDTWPQDNEIWQDGGAPVWNTPAVDPELGLLYFATGNPGPDYNGSIRKGDNLFSTSIVAVEAKTGKYRWHFQQVHHDIWDYDAASPVMLFDLTIDGVTRKGIAEASKTGWVYILDRANGKPLVGIDEKAVLAGAAAGHRADAAVSERRRVHSAVDPHRAGRHDARERRQDLHAVLDHADADEARPAGRRELAAELLRPGRARCSCARPIGSGRICRRRSLRSGPPKARDTSRAASAASICTRSACSRLSTCARTSSCGSSNGRSHATSGSVATAGGLVFVGRNDGRLTALDSSDGKKLWEFQTGAGMNSPATVFEHDGKQYVLAYSAGNLFAGTARGDSLWLFGLDGTLEPAPPAGALMTFAPAAAGRRTSPAGRRSSTRHACSATARKAKAATAADRRCRRSRTRLVLQTVSEGRNDMPSFGATLTTEQIRDVAAYVTQRLATK